MTSPASGRPRGRSGDVGVKDPVVDLVIVAAEDWAAATGWTPAD